MTDIPTLSWLIPETLTLSTVLILLSVSFLASSLTAALGIGGGALTLAVMAIYLPPAAIIPVHGLIQAGSNGNRALLTRKHIDRQLWKDFSLGAVLGALLASLVVIQLPISSIQLCIALFLLYLTWGPKLSPRYLQGWRLRGAALVTTLASMFIGASGPLVAAFITHRSEQRYVRVATLSACMTTQHGLKLLLFGWLGFAFTEWIGLICAMIATGFAGTWSGLRILAKVSDQGFNTLFKLVLTLLAIRLLLLALGI